MVAQASNADRPRRDVVRAGTIAEAGYLQALLADAGIEASTRRSDSFDAVTGAWSEAYVLSVATDDLAAAAVVLHAEGDAGADRLRRDADANAGGEDPTGVISPWRMLTVLTIAAASLAWAVSHRGRAIARPAARPPEPQPRPALPFAELARDLAEAPGGWQSADGVRKLVRTSDGRFWSLATDTNGDGRPDRVQRFTASPVAPPTGDR